MNVNKEISDESLQERIATTERNNSRRERICEACPSPFWLDRWREIVRAAERQCLGIGAVLKRARRPKIKHDLLVVEAATEGDFRRLSRHAGHIAFEAACLEAMGILTAYKFCKATRR